MQQPVVEKEITVAAADPRTTSIGMKVLGQVSSAWISRCIYAAVKLGILEAMEDGGRPASGIAGELGLQEGPLLRLLKALDHMGVVREGPNGSFSLEEAGRMLLRKSEYGLASMALLWGEEFHNSWDGLLESLRTGECAFEKGYGSGLFQYLSGNAGAEANFRAAMSGLSRLLYPGFVNAFDFGKYAKVVDVGGGQGFLLGLILKSNPHLEGILMDRDPVVADLHPALGEPGIRERVRVVAGDFFQAVPSGADLYILANILHDWQDTQAGAILRRCREAMGATGTLLLLEMAVGHDEEPALARQTDLNMLVLTGGREREVKEFEALLRKNGFDLERVTPVQGMTCLLSATPKAGFVGPE